jgi:hypothetical protein
MPGAWCEKSTGERKWQKAKEVRREFLDLARTGDLPRDTAKLSLEHALQNRFEFIEATGSRNSVAPTRTSMSHLKRVIGAARRLSGAVALHAHMLAKGHMAGRLSPDTQPHLLEDLTQGERIIETLRPLRSNVAVDFTRLVEGAV